MLKLTQLTAADYKASPERVIQIKVTAWDLNCPQHITPRYTLEQLQPELDKLKNRIKELENQLANK